MNNAKPREVPTVEPSDCSAKMAFDTREQAETAAVMAYHQRNIKLKTYLCQGCNLWHLSSR